MKVNYVDFTGNPTLHGSISPTLLLLLGHMHRRREILCLRPLRHLLGNFGSIKSATVSRRFYHSTPWVWACLVCHRWWHHLWWMSPCSGHQIVFQCLLTYAWIWELRGLFGFLMRVGGTKAFLWPLSTVLYMWLCLCALWAQLGQFMQGGRLGQSICHFLHIRQWRCRIV